MTQNIKIKTNFDIMTLNNQGEIMGEFLEPDQDDVETGGLEATAPTPPSPTKPAKVEIARTPEEQERLKTAAFNVAMNERGNFDEEDREINVRAAEFVTENSLKVAEARGLDVPAEYLVEIQTMLDRVNESAGVKLTMSEDALADIVSANPDNLPALYMALVDRTKPFNERGQTEPPTEAEIQDFIEAAKIVMDGKNAENDPLARVKEFKDIVFDIEGTRRDEAGESVLPADDIEVTLKATISDIVESGNATSIESITSDVLIVIAYSNLKKKKVPASWAKVPRDIRTNIELAVQGVREAFPDDVEVFNFGGEGEEGVGPIITFKKKE